MQLTFEALSNEALALPADKRAILANQLLESLDGHENAREVEAAWAQEIERRVRAFERGEAEFVPGDEALAKLKKKFAQ